MAELGVVAAVVAPDTAGSIERPALTLVRPGHLLSAGPAPDAPPAIPVLRVAVLAPEGARPADRGAAVVRLADRMPRQNRS
jgi:hypothetical protein